MKINSNSTAVITNNYLLRSEKALSASSQRLSSGLKINNACDNPSGYAISSKMRSQLKSLEKANNNADQCVDFIRTAEGALHEIHDMCQRMNELAVKAANGTNTSEDRAAINEEIKALNDEIERIANTTEYNNMPILNGNFSAKGYVKSGVDVKIASHSDDTEVGMYKLTGLDVTYTETPFLDDAGNPLKDVNGNVINKKEYTLNSIGALSYGDETTSPITYSPVVPAPTAKMDAGTNIIKISNSKGLEIAIEIPEQNISGDVEFELVSAGALRVQVGANEGQVVEMNIPEISLSKMGIANIDVRTEEGAKLAIGQVESAINYTSAVRSKLGAYQNRMEHLVSSLDVTSESLENSFSTIVDTDMASEMTEYTKLQVLQQAGTSMLAQANQFPQQALQLLQ